MMMTGFFSGGGAALPSSLFTDSAIPSRRITSSFLRICSRRSRSYGTSPSSLSSSSSSSTAAGGSARRSSSALGLPRASGIARPKVSFNRVCVSMRVSKAPGSKDSANERAGDTVESRTNVDSPDIVHGGRRRASRSERSGRRGSGFFHCEVPEKSGENPKRDERQKRIRRPEPIDPRAVGGREWTPAGGTHRGEREIDVIGRGGRGRASPAHRGAPRRVRTPQGRERPLRGSPRADRTPGFGARHRDGRRGRERQAKQREQEEQGQGGRPGDPRETDGRRAARRGHRGIRAPRADSRGDRSGERARAHGPPSRVRRGRDMPPGAQEGCA
mmetsp:Transcript_11614/g.54092  ORF Transcript_11614/g.54092 Transcript_11614/m.54092 type:complete len:330 (-) Transcript_11614:2824-3813(-)